MKRSWLRLADVIILGASLAATILVGARIYSDRGKETILTIESPGGKWVYSLDEDRSVDIPGPLGKTIIVIKGGMVSFIDSPCLNKTCIAAPSIHDHGEWNACLPNQVIARISSENTKDTVDALVY